MPFRVNVEEGVQHLTAIFRRIGELIEWDHVVAVETTRGRASFPDLHGSMRREISNDIHTLYSLFLSLANSIRIVLNRYDLVCTEQERANWRSRLEHMEAEVNRLNLGARFKRT